MTGVVNNSGTIEVGDAAAVPPVSTVGILTVSGLLTNSGTGVLTVDAGSTLDANGGVSNAGTITNNGVTSGAVTSNTGGITNNGNWIGNVGPAPTMGGAIATPGSGPEPATTTAAIHQLGDLDRPNPNNSGTFTNTVDRNGHRRL